MSLVAVARSKLVAGVEAPGFRKMTYDWRAPAGDDANVRGVGAALDVSDLGNALAERWPVDAHFVAYVVRERGSPLLRQPRVNKGGAAWLREHGYDLSAEVFVADVDNPKHGPWTPQLRAAFDEIRTGHRMLATAGVYVTAHGWRIVQPLARAMVVESFESALRAWLLAQNANRIEADLACADWTRMFRLPLVRRDGRAQNGELYLERMKPIDPPTAKAARSGRAARGKPRRPDGVAVARELPASWVDKVAPIAAELAVGGFAGERHEVALALGGALLARRAPAEYVPAIVEAIALAAGWDSANALKSATDTVDKWAAGASVKGARWLQDRAPRVLVAVDDATCATPPKAPPLCTEPSEALADALERMRGVLLEAPSGLVLVKAQCGIGKTRAAIAAAVERSTAKHKTPGEHVRAPLHSKTAIVVPTTKLAQELARDITARGVDVVRFFGVLSMIAPDGAPFCQYHQAGRPLASGGQSIPWEFCEGRGKDRCDLADSCPAYGGREGIDDARIAIGPHSMLAELEGWAGATGLLVVDEPPALLESETIRLEELKVAGAQLKRFEPRYVAAMAPAIDLVTAWLETSTTLDYVGPLHAATGTFSRPDLEGAAFDATGAIGWVDAARNAFKADHKGSTAPPIKRNEIIASRRFPAYAKQLGEASRVIGSIWKALNAEGAVVRVETRGVDVKGEPRPALICTWPNQQLRNALTRDGAVVALDAGAELHAPIMAKVVGYEPKMHTFAAKDGAQIERTLIRSASATRAAWMPKGKLNHSRIASTLRGVVEWALEAPCENGIGVITFLPVELAFRAARGEDVTAAWAKVEKNSQSLDEARKVFAPLLSRLDPRRIELGHFGAMRGLDGWKDLDALVTLGDPWRNLGDVQHEVDYLGLACGWEARVEAEAHAELEQAHGRLRTVHRTRPGRQLHVGSVVPGGWPTWDVRRPAEGRPANTSIVGADELRGLVEALGGAYRAWSVAGCSRGALARYMLGVRAVPVEVVDALRAACGSLQASTSPKGLLESTLNRPFGDVDPSCASTVDAYDAFDGDEPS